MADKIIQTLDDVIKLYMGKTPEFKDGDLPDGTKVTRIVFGYNESLCGQIVARNGAIGENPSGAMTVTTYNWAMVDVGTEHGNGRCHIADRAPFNINNGNLRLSAERLLRDGIDRATEYFFEGMKKRKKHPNQLVRVLHPAVMKKERPFFDEVTSIRYDHEGLANLVDHLAKVLDPGNEALSSFVTADILNYSTHMATSWGSQFIEQIFNVRIKMALKLRLDGMDYEFYSTHFIENNNGRIDIKREIAKAEKKARRFREESLKRIKAERYQGGSVPILVGPSVNAGLIHEATNHLASARFVVEEGSPTYNPKRLNDVVTDTRFSLVANPTMPRRTGYHRVSDEGVRVREYALIRDGRFVAYLSDQDLSERLRRLGVEDNPGCNHRFILLEYEDDDNPGRFITDVLGKSPRVFTMRTEFKESLKTFKELKNEFIRYLQQNGEENGLLLDGQGTYGWVDTDTGNFAIACQTPVKIYSDGREEPLQPVEVSMNVSNLMENLYAMGGKQTFCPHLCGEDDAILRVGVSTQAAIYKKANVNPVTRPNDDDRESKTHVKVRIM